MSRLELHKSRKAPLKIIVIGIFFSLLSISISFSYFLLPFPSEEKIAYFTLEHPIVFKGDIFEHEAYVQNGQIYLPYSFVKRYLDNEITFDESANSVIFSTQNKLIQLPSERLAYYVNKKLHTLQFPVVKHKDGVRYISAKIVGDFYPIQYDHSPETGAIIIREEGEIVIPAIVIGEKLKDIKVRSSDTLSSPYLAELKRGEIVFIESDLEDFYYIRLKSGVAGYIKKDVITLSNPYAILGKSKEHNYIRKFTPINGPINLTWEAIYSYQGNPTNQAPFPGVNIVSPTWFSLKDGNGNITNIASEQYVKWAKEHKYLIWALFSNDFRDPNKTHEALNDFETRQKIIDQLLLYAQIYQLDGLNIDFENVNYEDRFFVTQFMRELTPLAHEAGLVISMDITFISNNENWSKFYEREKLAEIVDYLIIMAYDEHWKSSPKAGSVASFGWVEKNLTKILSIIPNDRLILGIPLYNYLWEEEVTEDGKVQVSSKVVSMAKAEEWMKKYNLTPIFDEQTKQYYVEYEDDENKVTYKLWIEDEQSIYRRAQLVHQYELAGVASWSSYFATDLVWDVLNNSLKKIDIVKQ